MYKNCRLKFHWFRQVLLLLLWLLFCLVFLLFPCTERARMILSALWYTLSDTGCKSFCLFLFDSSPKDSVYMQQCGHCQEQHDDLVDNRLEGAQNINVVQSVQGIMKRIISQTKINFQGDILVNLLWSPAAEWYCNKRIPDCFPRLILYLILIHAHGML